MLKHASKIRKLLVCLSVANLVFFVLFCFGCVGSLLLRVGFSVVGATLPCGARASGSRFEGFSSCSTWALEHRLSSCGTWA